MIIKKLLKLFLGLGLTVIFNLLIVLGLARMLHNNCGLSSEGTLGCYIILIDAILGLVIIEIIALFLISIMVISNPKKGEIMIGMIIGIMIFVLIILLNWAS
ncbi:MAG: hypothetical protein QNJ37_24285 [Crocosphaera sp.]|nr:hypothetical protein [Crocosphaera sp.]